MELGVVYYVSEYEKSGIIICKDDTIKLFDIKEHKGIKANDYVTFEIDTENKEFAHILKPLREYKILHGYYHHYQLIEKKDIHNEDYINIGSPCGTTIRDTESPEMQNFHEKVLSIEEQSLVRDFVESLEKDNKPLNAEILENKGQEIWKYINKLDINKIVNSFKIEIKEYFLHKPGGDDRYYVDKEYSVDSKDEYITTLLPNKTEELYYDSGYCTAESMRTYSDGDTGRQYKEEKEYVDRFNKEYTKEHHYYILLNTYIQSYLSNLDKQVFKKKVLAEYFPIDKVEYYFRKHDCGLSTCCSKSLEEFVEIYNHIRE